MNILLCGEGVHDVGAAKWTTAQECYLIEEGWAQPLLRKVFGEEIQFRVKLLREISLYPGTKLSGLHGHGRKAAMARFLAKAEDCAKVIFITDADSSDDGRQRAKLSEIRSGFDAVANDVSAIGCVPQSTSESWLMSDAGAWEAVAPDGVSALPHRNPEHLWGHADDPAGNHPKHRFNRACEQGRVPADRSTRLELAENLDLAELRRRCPNSASSFLDDCA